MSRNPHRTCRLLFRIVSGVLFSAGLFLLSACSSSRKFEIKLVDSNGNLKACNVKYSTWDKLILDEFVTFPYTLDVDNGGGCFYFYLLSSEMPLDIIFSENGEQLETIHTRAPEKGGIEYKRNRAGATVVKVVFDQTGKLWTSWGVWGGYNGSGNLRESDIEKCRRMRDASAPEVKP